MTRILFLLPPNITYEDFVHPPGNVGTVHLSGSEDSFGSIITDIPLGIVSLSAYLKRHTKVTALVIDFNVALLQEVRFDYASFRNYFRDRLHACADFAPDYIAISAQFTPSFHSVTDLAEVTRELFPEAMVLAGGNLATAMHREMLASTACIDAVCYGEGELPLLGLIQAVDRAAFLDTESSWVTRKKLAEGRTGFDHSFIFDLDEIPPLDFDILDLPGYEINPTLSRYSVGTGSRTALPLMTSRGCPFKCTFCASHNAHGRKMRYHSVRRVLADVATLVENYGVRSFVVQDDHFMGDRDRAYAIIKGLRDLGCTLFFQNALAIYALDRRFLELLKSAGIDELVLPIESGSARVLKEVMRKPLKLDIVRRVVADCREVGIFTDCNVIVGMPGETVEDITDGRAFLKSVNGDWFRVFVATPLPGSEMFQECTEKRYFRIDPVNANYKRAVIDTPDWSHEYIQDVAYDMNIELNFVHNANFRLGRYEEALACFRNVLAAKSDHAIAHYYVGKCLCRLGDAAGAAAHFGSARHHAEGSAFWQGYFDKYGIDLDDAS